MLILDGKVSIDVLLRTKKQLDTAIPVAKSELEITGAIKCFEYTYEISWKTMKKVLTVMGVSDINSPRTVFAAAYKNKLIDDIDAWNHYITLRNLTTHTYDESLAHEVFESLPTFSAHVDALLKNLKGL